MTAPRPLAALRFPATACRGRRYPELSHSYRNEFQRDRDRIVHCRAFRRMEDKTQVFSVKRSDHFRTRLTHTLEVTAIARTVAQVLGLDEEFAEALALAHDLGHPPYAHAGEAELNRQMKGFGEIFDHNFHALRVVEVLERRYAMFPGLNLTFELREGIVKHSRQFAIGEFPWLDEYLPGVQPPLEAQLIDLVDEIAYNTADLDDARDAGIIHYEQCREELPCFGRQAARVEQQFAGAPVREKFVETLRAVLDAQVTGLIEGTVAAVGKTGITNVEELRGLDHRVAAYTDDAAVANRELKTFLRAKVYESPLIQQERITCERQVAALFAFLLENPDEISANFREYHADAPVHRVVCDYIAGMTDGFFRGACSRLLGAET
jgi:dGTPase